jgi:hypothetical protein
MKATKQRLSVSVDADLLVAAELAAKRGEVANVSAWVNDAMRLKLERDRGLAGLAEVVSDFEAEHGQITPNEMEQAAARSLARAITARGTRAGEGAGVWTRARPRNRRPRG